MPEECLPSVVCPAFWGIWLKGRAHSGICNLNPDSLQILKECYVEDSFNEAGPCDSFQFVRNGYFCIDSKDSTPENLVFNRIVSLKSSFKLPKK